MKKGTVYWITGLSGAGKTTVGSLLYQKMCKQKDKVVFLDGDMLRKVFNNDIGYGIDDRKKGAYRNGRLCHMLSEQGLDVVCCTISMFDDVREWNRQNIDNYIEVFLDVSIEVLKNRDQKGLYSNVQNGAISNVTGMDLQAEFPKNPDVKIKNEGLKTPEQIVSYILTKSEEINI